MPHKSTIPGLRGFLHLTADSCDEEQGYLFKATKNMALLRSDYNPNHGGKFF